MAEPFGTVGNGAAMAGNLESTAEAAAGIAAGVTAALAATAVSQAETAAFIVEWGHAVVDGHSEVSGPGGGAGGEYGD